MSETTQATGKVPAGALRAAHALEASYADEVAEIIARESGLARLLEAAKRAAGTIESGVEVGYLSTSHDGAIAADLRAAIANVEGEPT